MAKAVFKEGAWVKVWARVVLPKATVHPEDVVVELTSHNENYGVHVRKTHVEITKEIPEFTNECLSLAPNAYSRYYWQCDLYEGHPDLHTANEGHLNWTTEQEQGRIEKR